jgi:type IV pilus assembly protein PilB
MSILDTLAKRAIIEESEIPAIKKKVESTGDSLEEVLVQMGIDQTDILNTKGEYYGVPVKTVVEADISGKILEYIPEESAVYYQFVPVGLKDGVLEIGIIDPDNLAARDAINFISSKISLPYKIFLISEADFQKVVKMYKGLSGEVTKALSELETEFMIESQTEKKDDHKDVVKSEDDDEESDITDVQSGGTKLIENAPVTKIVATFLRYATDGGASDIHIEPTDLNVRVRFRVDGLMNTSLVLPNKIHSAIVARIKIMSNMRLDEKRKPQDGRFSAKLNERKIDFRVSTFPTYYGEKVVIRILDQEKGVRALNDLGLSEHNVKAIKDALEEPYGLILITGPTGSGKSTTLYSMLKELDREHENVLSLEDPIEYNLAGVSQSQVRPEIGYTFASGLRTTLRQDPDVIMVGEIRDKETAQLAIQAALTGHLVLSTLHTNTAIGAIPRLIDMGVDPYLIAPTLILAIAQRLVRTLPPSGGKPLPIDGAMKIMLEKQFEDLPEQFKKDLTFGKQMYSVQPSSRYPSGTSGRISVMEVLEIDKSIEDAILKNPTEPAILKIARQNGMLSMKEDAILKSFQGIVPFEEVNTL